MQQEIPRDELKSLVLRQVDNLFSIRKQSEKDVLAGAVDIALERCQYCFSRVRTKNKYYSRNGETYFNPFHSGQYSIFLYFVANTIFKGWTEHRTLADRVYYLNKALNCIDIFYEVNMPKVFLLDHPLGSVMGRAVYGEFFRFGQNCTVGNNKGIYPTLGENVRMFSGSKILGRSKIGDHVILSANAYVKDTDIPPCSIVFGSSPSLVIKREDKEYFMGVIPGVGSDDDQPALHDGR